jgi:hypothetical protein
MSRAGTDSGAENIKRHLTNEYHYAHFSKITKSNWCLTPSYFFAHPKTVYLNAGEALWIPKGWWHWIESLDASIAINFWSEYSDYDSKDTPHVICDTYQTDGLRCKIREYLSNTKVDIWQSDIDEIKTDAPTKNAYIISLPGYSTTDKLNKELFEHIDADIEIPPMFDETVDKNFWISLGYHDTGLHYDDYFGLLCVLEGKKKITLYPPSDSKYLHPHSIIPAWASKKPVVFEYNTYTFVSELDSRYNFPSSRLLYESIEDGNKTILKTISAVAERVSDVVWGCKLKDGVMRWELYMYHYLSDMSYGKNEKLGNFSIGGIMLPDDIFTREDLIIHSFDIKLDSKPVEPELHMYYRLSDFEKPFYGYGETVLNGTIVPESNYVLDEQDAFYANYGKYMEKIKGEDDHCKMLVRLYKCKDICVFNKNAQEFFIMYIGISLADFVPFLEKYGYPEKLISHVIEYKNKYENIKHEIAIVFNKKTLDVVRTAFYGLL